MANIPEQLDILLDKVLQSYPYTINEVKAFKEGAKCCFNIIGDYIDFLDLNRLII